MNANELFNESRKTVAAKTGARSGKKRNGLYVADCGLTFRTLFTLQRAGFVSRDENGLIQAVDRSALLRSVKSGDIWQYRNVGKKTVMEICEWLAETELSAASPPTAA